MPLPLPPDPPLALDGTLQQALERALLALGRLDSISTLPPAPELFIYSYVRKEALLSSQIEGTQSSLSDLLRYELEQAPGLPRNDLDVVEVSNYVAALDHGIARLREDFPLSNRLIRKSTACCSPAGAAATRTRASSGAHRTGSGERGPETHASCRRRTPRFPIAWRSSSAFCTRTTTVCRCWCGPDWRMSSSRPSTRSWTATDGLDVS